MKTLKTPKRLQPSIKHDFINPSDFLKYNLPWACENCTHYDPTKEWCSMGYFPKWHNQKYQKQSYELNGTMALCRFQEID